MVVVFIMHHFERTSIGCVKIFEGYIFLLILCLPGYPTSKITMISIGSMLYND